MKRLHFINGYNWKLIGLKVKTMKKVVVIGLDGATWELVQPIVDKGRLPNIKKILDQGTIGDLYSTIPPVTGPTWVSFATGCKPEKHGVFEFMKFVLGIYETKIITSMDINQPFFYEILSEQKRKCIIINLPH